MARAGHVRAVSARDEEALNQRQPGRRPPRRTAAGITTALLPDGA